MQRRFHCLRRCYGTRCPASWSRVPFLEIAAKILAAASSKDSIALLLYRIFFLHRCFWKPEIIFFKRVSWNFFWKAVVVEFRHFFSSVKRSKLKTGFGGKNRRPPGGEIFVDFRELFFRQKVLQRFFCTKLGTKFSRRFLGLKYWEDMVGFWICPLAKWPSAQQLIFRNSALPVQKPVLKPVCHLGDQVGRGQQHSQARRGPGPENRSKVWVKIGSDKSLLRFSDSPDIGQLAIWLINCKWPSVIVLALA